MANGNSEVTGIGMGSNTHQMTHIRATAAVMARAGLFAPAVVLISRVYVSNAAIGPAIKVIVFVVTVCYLCIGA